jgi:hypothetical protein
MPKIPDEIEQAAASSLLPEQLREVTLDPCLLFLLREVTLDPCLLFLGPLFVVYPVDQGDRGFE